MSIPPIIERKADYFSPQRPQHPFFSQNTRGLVHRWSHSTSEQASCTTCMSVSKVEPGPGRVSVHPSVGSGFSSLWELFL